MVYRALVVIRVPCNAVLHRPGSLTVTAHLQVDSALNQGWVSKPRGKASACSCNQNVMQA